MVSGLNYMAAESFNTAFHLDTSYVWTL